MVLITLTAPSLPALPSLARCPEIAGRVHSHTEYGALGTSSADRS